MTQNIDIQLIPDLLYDESEKAFNIELEEVKGGAKLDLTHCMVTLLSDDECPLVEFPKDAYPFMGKLRRVTCKVVEDNRLKTGRLYEIRLLIKVNLKEV